jgi:thiosulfate dehydrogenase [quinone] large subunit
MSTFQKFSIFFLRVALGWMYFWAGITKVLDPKWSAEGYIKGAKLFPEIYQFFLQPNVLPWVNLVNEWGLVLLGVSLILGIFVRFSAPLGVALMALYYMALGFPYPNAHSMVVDEHIIYIGALLVLASCRAGRVWGLDERFS